ncbi:MAG: hypothetical protein DCF30_11670 [Hyphomicrobiales bacterium]|nr:MAG: hypothetical protein DCF30_11670 [Hyphomicrobiales bacterium]
MSAERVACRRDATFAVRRQALAAKASRTGKMRGCDEQAGDKSDHGVMILMMGGGSMSLR